MDVENEDPMGIFRRREERLAAEAALRRLEVQERTEAAMQKLPPIDGDYCDDCGRYIEWDGHTEASHLKAELALERRVAAMAVGALVGIAQADFRGNRSQEQTIAYRTLTDIEELRKGR